MNVANAYEYTDDFDSYTNAQPLNTTSAVHASSSGSYEVSTLNSLSSPHAVQMTSSGASNYLYFPIGDTSEGVFNIITNTNHTNTVYYIGLSNGRGIGTENTFSFNSATTSYDFSTNGVTSQGGYTVDAWEDIIYEWREGDIYYEARFKINGVWSDWQVTDISKTLSDIYIKFRLTRSISSSVHALFDNLTIQSDDDYVSEVELQTGDFYNNPSQYDTKFTDLVLSGTSTVNFATSYYLDGSEVDSTNPTRYPTLLQLAWALRPETEFTSYGFTIDPTDIGNQTENLELDVSGFADGTYDIMIRFANSGSNISGIYPFEHAYIYNSIIVQGGQLVGSGENEFYDSVTYNSVERYKECSLQKLGGCIENVFISLFVPTQAQLQNFFEFQNEIPNRYPFAYAYETAEILQAIDQSEVAFPTYSLDIPLLGGEFIILSQDTIDLFLPEQQRELFKNVIFWFFMMMFLVMVFFTIGNLFGFITLPTENESTSLKHRKS